MGAQRGQGDRPGHALRAALALPRPPRGFSRWRGPLAGGGGRGRVVCHVVPQGRGMVSVAECCAGLE
jgi:hypothetical protein